MKSVLAFQFALLLVPLAVPPAAEAKPDIVSAFKFAKTGASVGFKLQASKAQPLENPAFVIANWGSADTNVSLKINGQAKKRGVDYRAGVEVDTDGKYTLVIWLPLSATETVSLEVGGGN